MKNTIKQVFFVIIGMFFSFGLQGFIRGFFSPNIDSITNGSIFFFVIYLIYLGSTALTFYLFYVFDQKYSWFLVAIAVAYLIEAINHVSHGGKYMDYKFAVPFLMTCSIIYVFWIIKDFHGSSEEQRLFNKSLAIVQQAFYPGTNVKIADYVVTNAQKSGATKLIGWSTTRISNEIYLIYYGFVLNNQNRYYCYEVNILTNTVRDATSVWCSPLSRQTFN